MTELDVINDMLAGVGESPLSTLDATHPTVAVGLRLISRHNTVIPLNKGRGFWFNRIPSYTLTPDTDGLVIVPGDVLAFLPDERSDLYSVVDGFLWNNETDSNIFTEDVVLSIVRSVAFDSLPTLAQDAVAFAARLEHTMTYDGDSTKIQMLSTMALRALGALSEQELRQVRPNVLNGRWNQGNLSQYFKNGVAYRQW